MLERAVVTRVAGDEGVYFVIERLTGPSFEHGPARQLVAPASIVAELSADVVLTATASDVDLPEHAHEIALRPLQQGDPIVVGSIGRDPDDWVVLGRIG